MGMPVTQVHTTNGVKTPVSIDWMQDSFVATVAGVIVSGTANYAIQFTLDDVNDTTVTPQWIDSPLAPTGTTTTKVVRWDYPVRFVRINIATITGTMRFQMIQTTS